MKFETVEQFAKTFKVDKLSNDQKAFLFDRICGRYGFEECIMTKRERTGRTDNSIQDGWDLFYFLAKSIMVFERFKRLSPRGKYY